jgi:hypothetical protein
MARETKAERQERERQAEVNRLAEQALVYPARLMAVLERLNNQYTFDLKVKNGLFVVNDSRERYDSEYELSYSWNVDTQLTLENLEWKLDQLEEEQREAQRRLEVKREAQRKVNELLSDEERELLGL